jgi:mono/diheme cytochrome c family protein
MNRRFLLVALCLIFGAVILAQTGPIALADPPKLEDKHKRAYNSDVQPVLNRNCTNCHGGNNPKGGLNLTRLDGVLRGGKSGAVIENGKSADSLIYQMIQQGAQKHMPPKKQLNEKEIDKIGKWIDSLPM